MSGPLHLVITPAHNERCHLARLIRSMLAQTRRPTRWVLVDDSSNDGTGQLIHDTAAAHDWVKALTYPATGKRAVGSRVATVVLWALDQVEEPWDFISKIDADLTLPPDYFARVLEAFETDARLGICGGACVVPRRNRLVREQVAADHTRGALKTYCRACWDAGGRILPVHGWDGIDGVHAQMHGFATRHIPDLEVVHHRPTGSFEGVLKGRFTAGRFAHYMGYHPAFMAARSLRRTMDWPPAVGGLAMLAGYCYDWARSAPVYRDRAVVEFLRRRQLDQLGIGRVLRLWRRAG